MVVKEFCAPYFRSNRIVVADNFYSNVNLARELWQNGLKYVGEAFLPNKDRQFDQALFGFDINLTMVSYSLRLYTEININQNQY